MKARHHWLFFGGLFVIVILDQLTKHWVATSLTPYVTTPITRWLEPVLVMTYVTNTGVVFGILPQFGNIFTVLVILVIVMVFIVRRSLKQVPVWVHLALGIITGGAFGNLIDRLLRGSVVDFLDFNFWPMQQWGIFNIADAAVVTGVTILLLDSLILNPDLYTDNEVPVEVTDPIPTDEGLHA